MDDAITRISAELAFTLGARAPNDGSRMLQGSGSGRTNRPWGEDYGTGKQVPNMDAPRLRVVGSWGSGNSSGSVRKNSVGNGFIARQWAEIRSFCLGTKVFIICCGVAAAIAVLRGADLFY